MNHDHDRTISGEVLSISRKARQVDIMADSPRERWTVVLHRKTRAWNWIATGQIVTATGRVAGPNALANADVLPGSKDLDLATLQTLAGAGFPTGRTNRRHLNDRDAAIAAACIDPNDPNDETAMQADCIGYFEDYLPVQAPARLAAAGIAATPQETILALRRAWRALFRWTRGTHMHAMRNIFEAAIGPTADAIIAAEQAWTALEAAYPSRLPITLLVRDPWTLTRVPNAPADFAGEKGLSDCDALADKLRAPNAEFERIRRRSSALARVYGEMQHGHEAVPVVEVRRAVEQALRNGPYATYRQGTYTNASQAAIDDIVAPVQHNAPRLDPRDRCRIVSMPKHPKHKFWVTLWSAYNNSETVAEWLTDRAPSPLQVVYDPTRQQFAWTHSDGRSGTVPLAKLGVTLDTNQCLTVALALSSRICVVTGGPGTGKTSVAAGIARLAREIEIEEEETHAAAPTGRAAVVLTQRMAQPPPATTIHRLLWASPQILATRTVRRQLKGTVVIDESSMLTTEMLAALIRSGENGFLRVVLVGDHNQLPPVGAGQPFHDIIALHQSGAFNRTGVDIAAIWLQRNYRQQGTAGAALAQAAAQVLAGQAPTPIQPWISVDTVTTEAQAIAAAAHWAAQHAGQCSQVLTPLRETAEALSQAIRQACPGSPEKVVQTVNRVLTINGQRLLLANGLIGTVTARWPNPGVILVEFPDLDAQAGAPIQVCYTDTLELEGALVEIAGNRYTAFHISDLLPAEAVTIHRGQGSEWEHVCLVLINDRHPERRRLLYTATTRPRETLHIITLPDVADKIAQGPPAPRVSVLLDLAERMLADMQKPAAPGLKPAV